MHIHTVFIIKFVRYFNTTTIIQLVINNLTRLKIAMNHGVYFLTVLTMDEFLSIFAFTQTWNMIFFVSFYEMIGLVFFHKLIFKFAILRMVMKAATSVLHC